MWERKDKMPIYKRCSRCGKRVPSGSTCSCVKNRHKEYDRFSRDIKSKKYYVSGEWKQIRDYVLDLDGGIDVYLYATEGRVVPADTVHHIIPLKDDWDKRNDVNNLMSLNHDTHSMIEQMYKKDKTKMIQMLQEMLKEYRRVIEEGRPEKF